MCHRITWVILRHQHPVHLRLDPLVRHHQDLRRAVTYRQPM